MNGTAALEHTIREKALAKGFDFNMGDVKYPESAEEQICLEGMYTE